MQVVFNGEIYNYRTLREGLVARGHQFRSQSDTEVIVHLYEEKGADCIDDLEGMFAIAIWDERARAPDCWRATAPARSRCSTIATIASLAFASEIKAFFVTTTFRSSPITRRCPTTSFTATCRCRRPSTRASGSSSRAR